jgi:hypothetical protein
MFEGKARSLPQRRDQPLLAKHYIRLEKLSRDKRFSLLIPFVSYDEKKYFLNITPDPFLQPGNPN